MSIVQDAMTRRGRYPERFLIWWTNQADHERAAMVLEATGLMPTWPKYLRDQFRSRQGRAGRGRLWAADQFATDPVVAAGVAWDEAKPLCMMADDAGGIVIRAEDHHRVVMLPGFVTTFAMTFPAG